MAGERTIDVAVTRVRGERLAAGTDALAVEAPLEIRVRAPGMLAPRTVSVTMRTPGDDAELAVGLLVAEGLVRDRAEVVDVRQCDPGAVRVTLAGAVDLSTLERSGVTTSACGVCGKTSRDALRPTAAWPLADDAPAIDASLVHTLPGLLREAQAVFDRTGGLHAAGLFDASGALLCLREDVGRHNAVDKIVGAQLLAGALPARDRVLLVSGRASYELALKAVMAGIPVLAAVGAPSSLAVSLAVECGLTLLGFVRDDRYNVYAGAGRVAGPSPIMNEASTR